MATSKERQLAKIMKAQGATGVPNEQTYVATAQEQAMAGNKQGAMDTMQYSAKDPAVKNIEDQDEAKMRENDPKTNKKYKEYLKALKKAKSKAN